MGLSTAGLIGAAIALALGLVNYRIIISALEKRLRALDRSATPQERAEFEGKIVLLKRLVLWTDIIAFPIVGYMIGRMFAS